MDKFDNDNFGATISARFREGTIAQVQAQPRSIQLHILVMLLNDGWAVA